MSVKKKNGIVRISKEVKGKKVVKYYTTLIQEYKGNKTISIWECDKEGKPEKDYPLLAMGAAKAEVLLQFVDEINSYVEGEE